MNEEEQVVQAFWDDFSEEYIEIQETEQAGLAEALRDVLVEHNILPSQNFLDLAGGAGRYLPAIEPLVKQYTLIDLSEKMLAYAKTKVRANNTQLIQQSQQQLFAQSSEALYDVVFSAMNPALNSLTDLQELTRLSRKWVVVFRLQQVEDLLFTPVEKMLGSYQTDDLLNQYSLWLDQLKINWHHQLVTLEKSERVTRDFFEAYFADELEQAELEHLSQQFFGEQITRQNTETISFEMFYWHKGDFLTGSEK